MNRDNRSGYRMQRGTHSGSFSGGYTAHQGFRNFDTNRQSYSHKQPFMPESVLHKQLVKHDFGGGNEGRSVDLVSNFFKIITKSQVVYQYTIDLKKMVFRQCDPPHGHMSQYDPAPMRRELEVFLKKVSSEVLDKYLKQNCQVFGKVPLVHDGARKIYSTGKIQLEQLPQVQTLTIGGREARFGIIISLSATIDLNELDKYYASGGTATVSPNIVPVYEQVFRSVIEKKFTAHQSSFYDLNQREQCNSPAFDFVRGFSISVRMTEFGLALNLHPKYSCLIGRDILTVEQFALALLDRQSLNPGGLSSEELKRVSKLLSGLKVTTKHTQNHGPFTIDKLSRETTTRRQFTNSHGQLINVQKYFQIKYNIEVKELNLVRTMTPLNTDSSKREMVMLPMELCYLVPDQFIAENKLPPAVQTEHLKLSTLIPNVYFAQVVSIVEKIASLDHRLFKSFGITLTTQPVKVPARVLPLPKVLTNTTKFHIAADTPAKWIVFCFDPKLLNNEKLNKPPSKLETFISQMTDVAKSKNLVFSRPSGIYYKEITSLKEVGNCMRNLKYSPQIEFVLIVLPSENLTVDKETIYNLIKFEENQNENLISQCVMADKVFNIPHGYFEHLLDKINAKLGGTNMLVDHTYLQDLPFPLAETMFVGADVNHPGDIEAVPLSIAAVVGSFDDNISHYSCDVRIQKKDHTETIHDIAQMLENVLNCYKEKNGGRYPRNVIIFRDGVGDGHVKVLRDLELAPIEETLSRLIPEVRIAFIIVQKRHIVRFGLTKQNISGRKPTYNVASGTVVDTHIVEPMNDGIILNSHYSQLGTSKPSKYTILRDDFSLTADQIERLCFFACHNCARTRKVISIPMPIRYADLAAYRAKQLTDAYQVSKLDQTTVTESADTARNEELIAKLSQVLTLKEKTSKQLFYI